MGHLGHHEKKAGRNDASASGSLPAQKIFSGEISFENAPRREVGHAVVPLGLAEKKETCPTLVNKL
ncbi:MAG: hypothetical protein RIS24_2996 [Verrucomicrobiota bacterium]|jgi:hypothetical protein